MPEQDGAVEHRLLVGHAADTLGQRQLPEEGFAQLVAMLGRQLFKPGSPGRVIDRPPDRLDVEPVTWHLLEFGAERLEGFQACAECGGDIGGNLAARWSEAEQNLLVPEIAMGSGPANEIRRGNPDRPRIGCVFPCHGLHHQRGVGDGARHRRDIGLIAEGILHLAVGDHPVALLEPDHAVACGRNPGRAAAIGCNRERRKAAGDRYRCAAAGAAARALTAPGVAGAAEQRQIGQAFAAEFRRRSLADQDRARRAQPRHGDGVMVGDVTSVRNSSEGGADAFRVDDVLDGERDALQKPRRLAAHDPAFDIAGLRHRLVRTERDEAIQFRPAIARRAQAPRL